MALDLCTYTFNITDNEKVFTPEHGKTTEDIRNEARLIYHKCRCANDVYADDQLKYNARRGMQYDALQLCEFLKTDIMLAKPLFHLRVRRIIYWTKLADDLIEAIKGWMESDRKTYRKKHGL